MYDILLAIRFETFITSVFFFLSCFLVSVILYSGPIRTPVSFPLRITLALSHTFPRFSDQASALPAGLLKVIEYSAVPEKFFPASPPKSVQDVSSEISTEGGMDGPPSTNCTFHLPSIS